ncbi:MAG TPA: site-specific DNA-methyltransferase [Ignavibacteriaceae bacterium]|jgi:site-specific DNA-methyltransferase (adenine-specific)|nr:MAG: site-specific DNA-methyltransferase [Ignavibacteriales bacterium UTCHB2]HQF42243.1 site-specific DNA-methyltransferase [Ignavibacteriaceae bacterium]HQI40171.1 site-specific DNA-methyltransferase [Ignavibacteriaceae bacterium]
MANKSHFNSGHRTLNNQKKNGIKHSSSIDDKKIEKTIHAIFIEDAVQFLKKLPDNSIQLILIDPPYNLDLDIWDTFDNYLDWAKQWLDEIFRVLSETGNCVIFGGFQYQDLKKGDLLEIMHYIRHHTNLRFTNLVIWYYKNGMSAHRFFANRHEEAIWLSKTNKYYFNLDNVRVAFDEETKELYKKDKRLNPASIEKGKNPTNVWEINRLNGNSKERVGHLTQKPVELIQRFVKSLSYKGSTVLDFFAGSGTTGRVCIEEQRHSILVDSDQKLNNYFDKHIKQIESNIFLPKYRLLKNIDINLVLREIDFENNKLAKSLERVAE